MLEVIGNSTFDGFRIAGGRGGGPSDCQKYAQP